jgi:diguanylate cyclase (GGDEF)-like protein
MDRLSHAFELAKRRENYLFAVLFLDLDRFKMINDSLGHGAGDRLLMAIAKRFQTFFSPSDTVARLGGDEFTVLMEDIKDVDDVIHICERLQQELTLPFSIGSQEAFTSVSIGIALSTTNYERSEDLLRDADTAMYRAKALGKARYEIFNAGMRDQAVTRLQLETDLRRALKHQEFQLQYQPIVLLETASLTGFEALVRWQHPERGAISPAEFIPIAEETGLILPLGQWVLREACRQMVAWQVQFSSNPSLTISVNISGRQFGQPNLIAQIKQILQETGLNAASLKLEITESVLMENTESATDMLLQLKALGVQLHMDDFGTGYSSLSYLHRFPVDMLKVDRSFVSRMSTSSEKSAIVQTIVTLAQNLGMAVTAEGIETPEQLAQLKELKCQYGQGYLFSKPVDAQAAEEMIALELEKLAHSRSL